MGIEQLLGKTVLEISPEKYTDELLFRTEDGKNFKMYHSQDCCEGVSIEDIVGDLKDLVGSPILRAEERTNRTDIKEQEYADDSFTWTFYELATIKGSVTIRWYGSSNGYYSEGVDFEEIE